MSTDSSDTEAHACQLPFDLDLLFLQHFPLALGINILLLGDIFLKILSLEMFFHFAQCLQIPSNIPSQVCFIRDRKDIESSHTTLKVLSMTLTKIREFSGRQALSAKNSVLNSSN